MKCDWPTCKDEALPGKKCCYQHGRIYERNIVPQPKISIPKNSAKGIVQDKKYKKLVKAILKENNNCEMKVPGVCTGKAQGLHHIQKRNSKNLMDETNLMRACNPCNLFAETHPLEAMQMGLVKSKYSKKAA